MFQSKSSLFKSNLFIVASIVMVTFILLFATEDRVGLTWNEPDYIVVSESYSAWFGELFSNLGYALNGNGIDNYWTVNHEHPPFDKIWSGNAGESRFGKSNACLAESTNAPI